MRKIGLLVWLGMIPVWAGEMPEKALDLRALEQSAGELASRGYVEEAARMLLAVDPAQRTARLDFVLGMLLDTDGREREAADAFIRVMAEPDDPAENPQRAARGYEGSSQAWQLSQMFQPTGGREDSIPGVFTGMQVPQSLVEAKRIVKSHLLRLAMEQGGDIWQKAVAVIPEIAVATPEQWREAMDFARSGEYGYSMPWWDFIQAHPANPLGTILIVEFGQVSYGKPEQVAALLKTNPPMRIQLQLRQGNGAWRTDNLEFLESLKPADWQDEAVRAQVLRMIERMFSLACRPGGKTLPDGTIIRRIPPPSDQANRTDVETPPSVTVAECARGLALLEKAGLADLEAIRLGMLRARFALLEDKPEEFLTHINAWSAAASKLPSRSFESGYGSGLPMDAVEHWRKKAGDAAAEALIARIESPVLRCQLSHDTTSEQRLARVNRELAALPKDAPVETRRTLIRIKWSFHQRGKGMNDALRNDLEALAADESDLRMAMEARFMLISISRHDDWNGEVAEADRLKLEELANKLMASPDAADREFAAQSGGYFGRSSRGAGMRNPQPVATRWGTAASFSNSGSRQNSSVLAAIIAMPDKELAIREAARYLESLARGAAGRVENFSSDISSLSSAKLLDDALARISLPADAGLGRRVAVLNLLDACGKTDRARSVLEEIAKIRPWETRWTVDLALRAPDDAEMHRLLDSVAERGDFDRVLGALLAPRSVFKPDQTLARLNRLAEWAARAKGRRGWIEPVMMMLANDGGGLQSLTPKNAAQLECFRRYVKLALDDRRLAESGFRMMFSARSVETPEAITDAARRVLLTGAYTSTERLLGPSRSQESVTLSALEHLVQVAGEKGDEVAFPAEFREQLQVADPASAVWLAKLLAAKTVAELPDVSFNQAQATSWVALARHHAALLRAVKLPGRDAWLTGVFSGNQYQSYSVKLRQVICASLLDAAKTKSTRERVFTWLEAACGPRKNWDRKDVPNDPHGGNIRVNLSQAAALILNSAAEADSATVLAVVDVFREARVPVYDMGSALSRLGLSWQKEMQAPRKATLDELLGNKREAAYTLGGWQTGDDSQQKLRFIWMLPQMLQNLQVPDSAEWVKSVKGNPSAGFTDLFLAWQVTRDRTLQRRALLKAAPDLAKLPVEIRRAVLASLTQGMHAGDLDGLPAQAAGQLREQLAFESKQRTETVRKALKAMKSKGSRMSGGSNQSYQLGSLLGPVIADDDALVAEILAVWQPLAEADKSGKEMEAFIGGLISNSPQNPPAAGAILRLLDSLWNGSPPPAKRNSNYGDPIERLWSQLGRNALDDPQLWKQVAGLSPKMQARFLSGCLERGGNDDFGVDPKLVKTLREAAKAGEVTRAALEWYLQYCPLLRDKNSKADAAALLGFAKALKGAGASVADITAMLCQGYAYLSRMDNVGVLMAETPALLDGLKTFTDQQADQLAQGVQWRWLYVENERSSKGAANSLAIYPAETAALMKFIFPRIPDSSHSCFSTSIMTSMVFATGDAELLDVWIKFAGSELVGDSRVMMVLLEKDRVAEAIALTPPAGKDLNYSGAFTSRMESQIAKISAVPTPQAFCMRAQLSLVRDASGADAPAEKYEARKARITDEFERVRSTLTLADRAMLCNRMGLISSTKHVPALDEFACEPVAKIFQKSLVASSIDSSLSKVFIPAICSRMWADELSGLKLLAAAIAPTPQGKPNESLFIQTIYPVQFCVAAYANRHDAKISQESAEIILAYAQALADTYSPKYQGFASQYVHLAATDPASLAAGLKRCGLEGVKPAMEIKDYGIPQENRQALMRVALLHPVASEALLDSLGPVNVSNTTTSAMLSSLREPTLRAKISPTFFLKWNRHLTKVKPQELEAIQLYATERRGDFDEPQRAELDGLLERLQK